MARFKIGLMGSSQKSFPGPKEKVFTDSADELAKLSDTLDYDLYVYPDTVITRDDALRALEAMERERVDFLLLQITSFSAGEIVPALARLKTARIGLWALPETQSEGILPLNSFCGLNMYKSILDHYLKDYRIKAKWFYGFPADAMFRDRLRLTVQALRALKRMQRARVALIGGIAPGFNDLYDDERKINRLFDGIYINRLHEYSEITDRARRYSDADVAELAGGIMQEAGGVHAKAEGLVGWSAKMLRAYREFVRESDYQALAISCWPKFQDDFKYSVCSVVAGLNDDGVVAACEGDLLSAVSMLALQYLADDETTLMDLSSFDEADDTVLMWHCGPAGRRFCREGGYTLGVNYHGLPHTAGQEPNSCGVVRDMEFDAGHATVMRIAGECDRYLLMEGDFVGSAKPSFWGSRGWMGNLKLNEEPVRVRDMVNTLLTNGFQHHYPMAYGQYAGAVRELFAWLGLRPLEKVPYADYFQNIAD
jgi:L-fucose isomerase-like protein